MNKTNHKKLSFSKIKESFEKENYIVLTKENEWINTSISKIRYQCPNEHIHEVRWSHWNKGDRCIYCKKEKFNEDMLG